MNKTHSQNTLIELIFGSYFVIGIVSFFIALVVNTDWLIYPAMGFVALLAFDGFLGATAFVIVKYRKIGGAGV